MASDQRHFGRTWSRNIDIADEMPSPEDINITTGDFDEMSFAIERALCEKNDISVHQRVDDLRKELETTHGGGYDGNCR